jgi:hypothetical protein
MDLHATVCSVKVRQIIIKTNSKPLPWLSLRTDIYPLIFKISIPAVYLKTWIVIFPEIISCLYNNAESLSRTTELADSFTVSILAGNLAIICQPSSVKREESSTADNMPCMTDIDVYFQK